MSVFGQNYTYGQEDKTDADIDPQAELVHGTVFPYRGMEQHGVDVDVDYNPPPDLGIATDPVEFEEPEQGTDPIPVYIVSSGADKTPLPAFVTRTYPLVAGQTAQVLGKRKNRKSAEIRVKPSLDAVAPPTLYSVPTNVNAPVAWLKWHEIDLGEHHNDIEYVRVILEGTDFGTTTAVAVVLNESDTPGNTLGSTFTAQKNITPAAASQELIATGPRARYCQFWSIASGGNTTDVSSTGLYVQYKSGLSATAGRIWIGNQENPGPMNAAPYDDGETFNTNSTMGVWAYAPDEGALLCIKEEYDL